MFCFISLEWGQLIGSENNKVADTIQKLNDVYVSQRYLDLICGFNLVNMQPDNIIRTLFVIRILILLFGLTNAPVTFKKLYYKNLKEI